MPVLIWLVLILAGLLGAAVSLLSGYAASTLTANPFQILDSGSLAALVSGFIGGFGAPIMWSVLGVGYAKEPRNANDSERERWVFTLLLGALLGGLQGAVIFAIAYPLSSSGAVFQTAVYVAIFIVNAELVGTLGRGFNAVLFRIVPEKNEKLYSSASDLGA